MGALVIMLGYFVYFLFIAVYLIAPLPAAWVSLSKGRRLVGSLGYLGFASLFVLFSEAYQNSPLHLIWVVGLALLLLGALLPARSGSRWEQRYGQGETDFVAVITGFVPLVIVCGGFVVLTIAGWLQTPLLDHGEIVRLSVLGPMTGLLPLIAVTVFGFTIDRSSLRPALRATAAAAIPFVVLGVLSGLMTGFL